MQGCGSGSGRIRCFCMNPDPVFNFLWIRIRFSNFLDPDLDPDQVNIRPDPQPCLYAIHNILNLITDRYLEFYIILEFSVISEKVRAEQERRRVSGL